jgi:flagellar hook-basal body complex protein FliE
MADGVVKPMRVDTSLTDSIAAAAKASKTASTASTHKSSGQASFKSVLKAASTDTTSSSSSTAAETTQPVAGHAYSEVLTGPRAGMYINTSHNKRAGQAFVMVERNGVEYHVYGTGKNRTVVEMKRHSPAPATTTTPATTSGSVTPDTGTTTTSGTSSAGVTAGQITTDTSTL